MSLSGATALGMYGKAGSPAPLDVRPATARALIIELHLVFDFFLERQRFFPIDLRFQASKRLTSGRSFK
jgi:hypothetical protein